jgi:excisionase family DNA binding protein
MNHELPEMMTTTEVANFLRVHRSTVNKWASRGILRSECTSPTGWRLYKREVVLNILEKYKQ